MSALANDIRYALRQMRKNPGFTAVVVLVVALAVGANTAIFNALDQIALRPLPVKKARELVSVQNISVWDGRSVVDGIFNYPTYEAYRDRTDVFSGLAAFSYDDMSLRVDGQSRPIQGMAVSADYFSVLGVTPSLGRAFSPDHEPDPAAAPIAIVSDRFRQEQFGPDADAIGEQVVVNDRSLTIVGVTPAGFTGSVVGWVPDVYVPLGTYIWMRNDNIYRDTFTWLHFLGRLQPGVSRNQARAALTILNENLAASGLNNVRENMRVADGSRGWMAWDAQGFDRPLALFMGAAAFVLVIASLNIANMQLSRALTRQKEIAIRQALGAGRWRVVRQLLVEGLLLALAGGVCGVALAVWLDRVLCALLSRIGSISMIPGLDSRVVLVALGVSLLTGLVFGLAPALRLVRRNVTPTLKDSAGFVGLPGGRWNSHHLLVTFQIAGAVVVLICAGLFVHSTIALNRIDPGYDPRRLLAVSLEGPTANRPDQRRLLENLHERIRNLPGMEASCLAQLVPLSGSGNARGVSHIDGVEIPEPERTSLWYGIVGPGYFRTLNMPLVAGRIFSDRDGPQTPRVMVINDVMAQQYWPDQNPVGKTITFRDDLVVRIIGVVKASRMRSLIEGVRPIAYWPLSQGPDATPVLLVRTRGRAQASIPRMREIAATLGPNETWNIGTVADRVAARLFPQHAMTIILNAFGLAGLLLCVTGIYGVMAYAVGRQTREIGIRIALGAESHHVIGAIVRRGTLLTAAGLGLGLAISPGVLRLLQSQVLSLREWNPFCLFGVDLFDPVTLALVPLSVLIAALVACYLPARRAARIDPMEALRYE